MKTPALDTRRQQQYLKGRTAVYAYPADPRFSYCLYIPKRDPSAPPPGLVVAVHHSLRNFMQARDAFVDFADRHNQVILAPLFPIGVQRDGNPDGYKYLIEGDIRYDLLLEGMVEEAVKATGCDGRRFCLFGFSGGGHFTHRYLMTHPERLIAASIGAPGQVTLLDTTADWWVGVRDLEALFGRPIDLGAMRRVPVQMIVGADDTDTEEISHAPGSTYWRVDGAGVDMNRIDRLRALQSSYEAAGISVQFDLMPGIGHVSVPAMTLAQAFFERHVVKPA